MFLLLNIYVLCKCILREYKVDIGIGGVVGLFRVRGVVVVWWG